MTEVPQQLLWIIAGSIALSLIVLVLALARASRRRKAMAELARQTGFEFAETGTLQAFRAFDLHETPEQRRQLVERELARIPMDNPAIAAMIRSRVEKAMEEEPELLGLTSLRELELIARSRSRTTQNVMTGYRDGVDIVVFDLSSRSGEIETTTRTQTVVALRHPRPTSGERRSFKHSGWSVETNGDVVLAYRPYRRIPVNRIPRAIEEALSIARG